MGAFICQISEQDWSIALQKGVYGNRENKPDGSGSLRIQDKMSVIRDLISIKPGDIVLFHVVKGSGESTIHGVYKARSEAFSDRTRIWENNSEIFPFRFLFEPHPEYKYFCKYDCNILISDFYREIESRTIWSLATLENERNMERRAVRKISMGDARKIVELLLRDFKQSERLVEFSPIAPPTPFVPLESEVMQVGTIENSIKAVLMSKIKKSDPQVSAIFGKIDDYMNETFVAQTTRKLFDLLCVTQCENNIFYIIEAKVKNYNIDNLEQLLNYMDLFKQKPIFGKSDKVVGCTLSISCTKDVYAVINIINTIGIFDGINVIKYTKKNGEKDADVGLSINNSTQTSFQPEPTTSCDNSRLNEDEYIYSILPKFGSLATTRDVIFKKENVKVVKETSKDTSNNWTLETKGYYIKTIDGLLNQNELQEFLHSYRLFVEKMYNFDYMKLQPIIIAKKIEESVSIIVNIYNKLLRRQRILLFEAV